MNLKLLERAREAAANRNMTFSEYLDFLRREQFNTHNNLTPAEQWDASLILKAFPKAMRYRKNAK